MSATAQKIVNRPAMPVVARQPVLVRSTPGVAQFAGSLKVSSPSDPAEREAEHTARRIMRMASPQSESTITATCSPHAARFANTIRQSEPLRIARKQEGPATTSASVASEISASQSSGNPLPASIRKFMEPRFNADFSQVRIHTGEKAAKLNRQVSAHAFTVGKQVFFGNNKFRPESNDGRELIAHELTHTIQQGAAVQRSVDQSAVTQRSPSLIQRGLLSALGIDLDPRKFFAEKAAAIPGFTMLTVIIGFNPITGESVDRSAGNILKGAIEMIPVIGVHITSALNNHGIFDKVSVWAAGQFKALSDIGSSLKQSISDFIKNFDITSPLKMLELGKQLITEPITRIKNFAINLANDIITFIKDAILKPIAAFAKANAPNGYDLLCGVLGKDPISGDPVPRSAETLVAPFMKLIGQEEVWENMKKSNAIPRAWAWFQSNLAAVKGFVQEIPGLFIAAFKSLEIIDIVLIPKAFAKLVKVFGGFVGQFITWAGNAVWNLLEIIFDSVKPGLMGYIKKTGAALKGILKNPLPFVGNLVKAAKLGFSNFADNFWGHLKTGLIDWLTGSLVGVYIPKALSLPELGKCALSVLGITWAGIRKKLVKAIGDNGEKIVGGIEKGVEWAMKGFEIIQKVATGGMAAAWEMIQEKLTDLKDTLISGIIGFVTDTIVKKAIPKLIAMFIPGAGFISAIISIYDTIMVFVQKISKIVQVVVAFIDSIVAIAGGNISAAAKRVESILGGLLSLAISFLAGFLGLGKVTDKIKEVIDKVRDKVDKAIDAALNWVVTKAKALIGKLFGKKDKDTDKEGSAVKAKVKAELSGKQLKDAEEEKALISSVYDKYKAEGLKGIRFKANKQGKIDVIVCASPAEKVAQLDLNTPEGLKELSKIAGMMSPFAGRTTIDVAYGTNSKKFKTISQKRGLPGHAEHWLMLEFPSLMEKIRREYKTLKNPLVDPIPITLSINRTPCDGCANSHIQKMINNAKSAYPDVKFTLSISSASISQGAQLTTEKGLAALMANGVKLDSSTVWTEIKKQMKANGIKQIEYGSRHYDIDDVNEFIAHATDVQELVDKTVASVKKSEPAPAVQGSGA